MQKVSKFLSISIIGTALITLGFGCKGLTAAQVAAIRPVTLNVWTVYDDVGQLENFANQYHLQRPYVTINIRQVRYDEFDRLFTNALADDVAPDVVSLHSRWLRRYQSRLLPMPAQTKVARVFETGTVSKETQVAIDTNILPTIDSMKRDYVAAVPNDAVLDGRVYGLPLSFDTLALYYNKDLLDKAGIPEPPKNWDEFIATIKQARAFDKDGNITQAGVALGTGKTISNSFDLLSLFMMQNGVTMAVGRTATFATGVDKLGANHPAIKALSFYTDFARPDREVYTWNDKLGDAFDSFVRGSSVFYFGYAYDYPRIKSRAPEMDLQVLPLFQTNSAVPVNIANYWLESVVKKTKHPDEAWDFVRFITQDTSVKKYTDATLRPSPFRKHIKDQSKDQRIGPFAAQALTAKNWYAGNGFDAAASAMVQLIDDYAKPYADGENGTERDVNLLRTAQETVQQTM